MSRRLSDIESRDQLITALNSLRAAAIYDLFGQTLLHNFYKDIAAGKVDANGLVVSLPEGSITLEQFNNWLNGISETALVETKRNANRALTRTLFKETFRITESYCRRSKQISTLRSASWFEFARIIANGLSHDFRMRFSRYDLTRLPVTYNGIRIDETQDGNAISLQLEVLVNLMDDMIEFSSSTIS